MPTKQFKWIDRDTAARDMLQLVYHAPSQIAKQALKLLKAFRSPAIIPELKAIFLDEEYDVFMRREIYEVICATPGDFDFSEFELVIDKIFSLGELPGLFGLIKNHPINKEWMLHYLEVKPRYPLYYIYSKAIEYMPELVSERTVNALSENKIPLGINLGFQLYKFGGQSSQIWLEKNCDKVLHVWLTNGLSDDDETYGVISRQMTFRENMLNQWPELKSALAMLTLESLFGFVEAESMTYRKLICIRLLPYAPKTAFELLSRMVEEKQIFLDLEIVGLLHEYGDESVQSWLVERWDELIYVCLTDAIGSGDVLEKMRIVPILEKWTELKEAVFQSCPAIVEEYEEKRNKDNKTQAQAISDEDIKASTMWQEIEKRRDTWVEKTEIGVISFFNPLFAQSSLRNALQSESNITQVAAETYFVGTILHYDYRQFGGNLRHLLRKSQDQWIRVIKTSDDPEMTFVYSPIRFEAAYAIRNVIEPLNWECMVEAFLMCKYESAETPASLEDNLLRWISRMTDMLSGVEPELPDEELPLHARPWFCALVQQESNTPKV